MSKEIAVDVEIASLKKELKQAMEDIKTRISNIEDKFDCFVKVEQKFVNSAGEKRTNEINLYVRIGGK